MKKIIIAALALVAFPATAQTTPPLEWVDVAASPAFEVRVWDISRDDFIKATVDGVETLAARHRETEAPVHLKSPYDRTDDTLASTGTHIPYAAWHGPHMVFDGTEIRLQNRSEMANLHAITVSDEEVVRFRSMKAKDGGRAYAPDIRTSRYQLDFPRGGTRSGVYATPKGRSGYAYHLITIDG